MDKEKYIKQYIHDVKEYDININNTFYESFKCKILKNDNKISFVSNENIKFDFEFNDFKKLFEDEEKEGVQKKIFLTVKNKDNSFKMSRKSKYSNDFEVTLKNKEYVKKFEVNSVYSNQFIKHLKNEKEIFGLSYNSLKKNYSLFIGLESDILNYENNIFDILNISDTNENEIKNVLEIYKNSNNPIYIYNEELLNTFDIKNYIILENNKEKYVSDLEKLLDTTKNCLEKKLNLSSEEISLNGF